MHIVWCVTLLNDVLLFEACCDNCVVCYSLMPIACVTLVCRLSFPSGHASLAVYSMVFLVVGRYFCNTVFMPQHVNKIHINNYIYNTNYYRVMF